MVRRYEGKNVELKKYTWKEKEKDIAKKIGGKRVYGSGNLWFEKGDIKLKDTLVEVKTTDKKSISVKLSVLKKIEKEAYKSGRKPILILDIRGHRYIVVKLEEML